MMLKKGVCLFTILSILASCASSGGLEYISYFDKPFPKTEADIIVIYSSRLKLPEKFYEIGVIKNTIGHTENEIEKLAKSKGADALIRDGENYVLIKYINKKEKKNEKGII